VRIVQEVLPDGFQAVTIELLPRLGGGIGCGAVLFRKLLEVAFEDREFWPANDGGIEVEYTVTSTVNIEIVVVVVTVTVGLTPVLEELAATADELETLDDTWLLRGGDEQ
jgi:hypothetical protein